jgi:phytoene dehydrogenase-like protein
LATDGLSVAVFEAADEIGGGAKSAEVTLPGLMHDLCSAVHPFGVASPVFRSLGLEDHGLEWVQPPIALAHPLDDGTAGVMHQSLDQTADGLGSDRDAWRGLFDRTIRHLDHVMEDMLGPLVSMPRHLGASIPFGLRALLPASVIARRFETPQARAMWAGIAAHAISPLSSPATGGVGLMFGAVGQALGWPLPRGGSQSITNALAAVILDAGGTIETGMPVTSLSQLPDHRLLMLDTSPSTAADLLGHRLPDRVERAYRKFRHGPAAFKVDLAVEGGIPWTNEDCRRAGTVHVGGTWEQIAAGEADVAAGRVAERPLVLVAQAAVADPDRAVGDVVPIWAYAHVPNGWNGDGTTIVEESIERFAPGFRDRIVGRYVMTPADLEARNANIIGGDIAGGANSLWQTFARPRLTTNPYATGVPGAYLCSSSTPPGAGVHGLCGKHAVDRALAWLHRQ